LFKKRKWFRQNRATGSGPAWKLGYVLALAGGIVIIILSLARLANFPLYLPINVPLAAYFGIGVISLILGVVAVFGSKRVNELLWGIVLMIVGFLAGGVGGLLALIGGLVGLLSRYV
jgi:MFS superfamily sulfate permease-like transporter